MENAGTKFNAHGLSDEFVEQLFHNYVLRKITVDEDEKVPVCPFETCGECNTAYSDGCYGCKFARKSFQKILDNIYKRTDPRSKAQVFCVVCGAQKRTLRKWHNSYLCEDCYKIMLGTGEECFIMALRGETDDQRKG